MKTDKIISIATLILGLLLVASIFLPYGVAVYFFSKLFVLISGLLAIFDSWLFIKGQKYIYDSNKIKITWPYFWLYFFTMIWVFFGVGSDHAGVTYGQAYSFNYWIFEPLLLSLLVLSVLDLIRYIWFKKHSSNKKAEKAFAQNTTAGQIMELEDLIRTQEELHKDFEMNPEIENLLISGLVNGKLQSERITAINTKADFLGLDAFEKDMINSRISLINNRWLLKELKLKESIERKTADTKLEATVAPKQQDKTLTLKEEVVNGGGLNINDKISPSPKPKNKLVISLIILGCIVGVAVLMIILINPFKISTSQNAIKESDKKEKIETQENIQDKSTGTDNSEITNKKIEIGTEFIIGTWKGKMGGKNLTIVIEEITNNSVKGYNILDNNKRNLNGNWEKVNYDIPCCYQYHLTLNEPGDDKWDGVFEIDFVACNETNENENGIECLEKMQSPEGNGNWRANNGKLEHSFEIKKGL